MAHRNRKIKSAKLLVNQIKNINLYVKSDVMRKSLLLFVLSLLFFSINTNAQTPLEQATQKLIQNKWKKSIQQSGPVIKDVTASSSSIKFNPDGTYTSFNSSGKKNGEGKWELKGRGEELTVIDGSSGSSQTTAILELTDKRLKLGLKTVDAEISTMYIATQ
jgi:hypothetical protein